MEKKNNLIAEKFRAVRRELGFTQQQLASQMLMSRNYIAKIEAGIQEPGARVLVALHALRVRLVNKRDSGIVDSANAAVGENEQAAYGTGADIERDVRREFESLIEAAAADPERLHWIIVQLREHLAVPKSWRRRSRDLGVDVVLPSQNQPLSLAPTVSPQARRA